MFSVKARGKIYGEEDKFTEEVLQTTMHCVVAFLVFWVVNAGLYMALFIDVQVDGNGPIDVLVSFDDIA